MNNFLEITNINYNIDIPEINWFGEYLQIGTSNLIFERTESQNSDTNLMIRLCYIILRKILLIIYMNNEIIQNHNLLYSEHNNINIKTEIINKNYNSKKKQVLV